MIKEKFNVVMLVRPNGFTVRVDDELLFTVTDHPDYVVQDHRPNYPKICSFRSRATALSWIMDEIFLGDYQ